MVFGPGAGGEIENGHEPKSVVAEPIDAASTKLAALAAPIACASVQVDPLGAPASVTKMMPALADVAATHRPADEIQTKRCLGTHVPRCLAAELLSLTAGPRRTAPIRRETAPRSRVEERMLLLNIPHIRHLARKPGQRAKFGDDGTVYSRQRLDASTAA